MANKNCDFWWKFNFKGSKEIIFRVGHVTVGLHMFHNVNFWLDLKIKSKNIRIFQIVDSNSKMDKTLKFVFQNIKKWTCEFSSANFLKNGKFWQKINSKLEITSGKNITVISWIFVSDILEGTLLLTSRFRPGKEPDRKFDFQMF